MIEWDSDIEEVDELEARPILSTPWEHMLWSDFGVLVGARTAGFAVGPIPPSEIIAFQEKFRPHLDIDSSWFYLQTIRAIDAAHRAVRSAIEEHNRKKK
jgi:hypothetical protein